MNALRHAQSAEANHCIARFTSISLSTFSYKSKGRISFDNDAPQANVTLVEIGRWLLSSLNSSAEPGAEDGTTAPLIVYAGKRARPDEAKKRADRVRQYLGRCLHFPDDRIKVINGGYREQRDLALYVVSEGTCPPTPFPTVDPRGVEIIRR